MQHFPSLRAIFVHQPRSNPECLGERCLHNLVEISLVLLPFESIYATYSEHTVEPRKDSIAIVCVQKLHGDIHEVGPLPWKIILQYFLKDGYKLRPDLRWG